MAEDPRPPVTASDDGMRLAVLIINYRTLDLTIRCVGSFVDELLAGRDCAIVVDNASGDGSGERLANVVRARGWTDRVKVLQSQENGGFSSGHNLGLREVRAEAYVLLNSDTIMHPGTLDEIYQVSVEHPRVGIIGPRLEGAEGRVQASAFRDRTPVGEFLEAANVGPLSRLLGKYEVVLPVTDEPAHVAWLSFACVLLRGEMVDQIGVLDDGFFMYFEDADYCRRARAAGWGVLYWPKARVVHFRGGSDPSRVRKARERRERPPACYYASRSRYFAKAYGRSGLWMANLLWHAGRVLSFARETLGGRYRRFGGSRWRDIWQNAGRPLSASSRSDSR